MNRQSSRHWRNRAREGWRLLLLAIGCLLAAWVFAKTASELLEGEMLPVDLSVRQWMLAHRVAPVYAILRVVTELGAKEVLAPIAAFLGWWLFRGGESLVVLFAFCGLAAGEFVAMLKRSFHIARPAGGIAAGLGFSFPSGHATGAAAVAVVLSYVAVRRGIHPRIVVPVSVALALLIGFSRLYLDVHWMSDVAGGWLVGVAFGTGCCAVYELMTRSSARAVSLEPSRGESV